MNTSNERLLTIAAASALLLGSAACSGFDEAPKDTEISTIIDCNGYETNVEPTYLPAAEGYSPTTDPTLISAYEKSLGGTWGIGTVVCRLTTEKYSNGNTRKITQVLSQRGLTAGLEMNKAQK